MVLQSFEKKVSIILISILTQYTLNLSSLFANVFQFFEICMITLISMFTHSILNSNPLL